MQNTSIQTGSPVQHNPRRFSSLTTCVNDLTAIFCIMREIMRQEAACMPAIPYWESKIKTGEHVLQDAEGIESILKRLHELKAASAEHKQTRNLDLVMREIASAPTPDDWLHGLYTVVKPWVIGLLRGYLSSSDPVMDLPTHQVFEKIIRDQEAQIAWFEGFTPSYSEWENPERGEWCENLQSILGQTKLDEGSLQFDSGDHDSCPGGNPEFTVSECARRDRSFRIGTATDLLAPASTFEEERIRIFALHTQEMQFAESLAVLMFETKEMPWAFHYDLARHLADEVRHTRMGEVRLNQLGIDLKTVPMLIHNYAFRATLDPVTRFCMMTLVLEAGSFESKRANVKLFEKHGDEISTLYESFDIRDEMLHTNFGHLWVPIMLRVFHDTRSVQSLVNHCKGILNGMTTEYSSPSSDALPS